VHATTFVRSYFDAWNHADPVAVAEHLSSDGIYIDVPENSRGSHDELIISLAEFFANHRHRYELVGEILEGPHTIAFQYVMRPPKAGRNDAPQAVIRGAEFITMHRGVARRICDYYDTPGKHQPLLAVPAGRQFVHGAKYAKSGLGEARLAAYRDRLDVVMRQEQVYLQIDLTLPKLAEIVGCSVNHLSQVINAGFGMSFFDYLNQFRIEHAKRLFAESSGRGDAALDVAFAVGFSANSTFYTAFKRYVGETPAQYRRKHRQVSH